MTEAKKNGKRGRKQGPNLAAQDAFIAEYFANGGRKKSAGDKLGIGWTTIKTWFANDEKFRERLEEFREMWRDQLRAMAYRRAMEKSDVLLMFLLKSLEPETYDDATRRDKYLADHNLQSEAFVPVRAVLVRDEEPEAVKKAKGGSAA